MHGKGLASCLGKSTHVGRCRSAGIFYLSSYLQGADWPPEKHLTAAFERIAAGCSGSAAAAWPAAVCQLLLLKLLLMLLMQLLLLQLLLLQLLLLAQAASLPVWVQSRR